MSNHELLNYTPTTHYDVKFARKVGINAAIILSRIVWSINSKIISGRIEDKRDETWWMWDSIATFCEYSGMSKDSFLTAKKKLESANLIIIEKMNKKTLDHTNHYAVNWEEYRRQFPDSREAQTTMVEIPDYQESGFPTADGGESLPSIVGVPVNVTKSLSYSPPESLSKNLSKGGDARVRKEEAPPPLDNVLNFPFDEEERVRAEYERMCLIDDDDKSDEEFDRQCELAIKLQDLISYKSSKKAPPTLQKSIGEQWYCLIRKNHPDSKYSVSEIEHLANKSNIREEEFGVGEIIGFVDSMGSPFLKSKFFEFPDQVYSLNQDGETYMQEACRKFKDYIGKFQNKRSWG